MYVQRDHPVHFRLTPLMKIAQKLHLLIDSAPLPLAHQANNKYLDTVLTDPRKMLRGAVSQKSSTSFFQFILFIDCRQDVNRCSQI